MVEFNHIIVLLRSDLRVRDNPALHAAIQQGRTVSALYVFDTADPHQRTGASLWWLNRSLRAIEAFLTKLNIRLILRRGDNLASINETLSATGSNAVFWNRRYATAHIEQDKAIKSALGHKGIEARSFSATLLREPWEIATKSETPFKVFTPFWKTLRHLGPARDFYPIPGALEAMGNPVKSDAIDNWALAPTAPNWAAEFETHWTPGEHGAQQALRSFIDQRINDYAENREIPSLKGTSLLSPHLAFGEISALDIWHQISDAIDAANISAKNAEKFLSEIAWREFSYHLLYHNPTMPNEPLRENFANFPWREDNTTLTAWQLGQTGIPIIDAGMRQLWRTGWMHNRVRMIVASFLTKNLRVNWIHGERWFWDTLVDADIANNSASWQWVAGCGADAAPYFRIFNPVTQGERFDPDGTYVKTFVPELADLHKKHIHAPWKAPDMLLANANIKLGETYPLPIVDLAISRRDALKAYEEIKG